MPGNTGLIVALDTGSTGDPLNRTTGLVESWSVEKTVRMGASGAKLLLYYHPEGPEAKERETLVQKVEQDCAQYDILFSLSLYHVLLMARIGFCRPNKDVRW